jgi:radical SAM protein with 4Fe4S-binding SPASM domain
VTSAPRATPCLAADDSLRIETAPDGEERFFRADGSVEYTYARPFILELEITRRCNLRCLHCYAHAGSESANELSRAEIRGFLDQARALGIDELSLTGGEATLHPDFVGIIDDALERGFHVRFVTNGTLFDRPLLRALCARPIKLITISLDGVSPEAHERIRGPGSHAKTMRAIDELQAAGFALSLITAFSKLNVGELDALLGFCVSRGLDWQVQMTSAKGRCPRPVTLSPEQYYWLGQKVAAAFTARLPINIVPMDDLAMPSLYEPLSALWGTWKGRCVGGLLNLFVRANGEVTPCSAMAFPGCAVGNLHRERLADICGEARCRKLLEERFGKLSGVCASCPFGHACRGGCPDILYSMCERPTENEYCFYRLEQQELLAAACPNRSEE